MPQGHIHDMAKAKELLTRTCVALNVGECVMYKLVLGSSSSSGQFVIRITLVLAEGAGM